MDFIAISILFLVMFFISLLWRYWLNDFLKTKPGKNLGVKPVAPAFEADPSVINHIKETFEKRKIALSHPKIGFRGISPESVFPEVSVTHIQREVKVQYSRSVYVHKSFSLKITIAAKGVSISKDEKEIYRIKTEELNFQAYEPEPKVTVELKFAEDDFKISKKKKSQKLNEKTPTIFKFIVTPLKAKDCILTAVFSYIAKIPMPEKTTEKVIIDKTITPAQGKTTTEHSEQTTTVPIQIVEKEIEIKSIDLVISVKSLLGLNAKQLDLAKKGAVGVGALIILAYQIISGELEGTDAIISAAVSILPVLGVEGADKFVDRFLKNKEED